MSQVMTLWLVVGAGALVLATIHALVWLYDRQARVNLAFALVSLALAATVWVELGMMHSTTPYEWGQWVRWYQAPLLLQTVAMLAFVRLYLGTGRPWLMWTIIALRLFIVAMSFATDPNFNFERIDTIERINFLGEQVSIVGQAVPGTWQWIATLATVLYLLFVVDATYVLWRRGSQDARRKAIVVGGAILISLTIAVVNSQLVILGIWKAPMFIAPPFLLTVGAMAFEMTRETLRASRLSWELSESERRLEQAAQAGGLGLWSWDARQDHIWATDRALGMFERSTSQAVTRAQLLATVHPDDAQRVLEACRKVEASDQEQETQFRVRTRDGAVQWLLARGRAERDAHGRVTLVRGVLRDVTAQHEAQQEMERLRSHLTHASRVTVLGQLSAALAHELRQPLAAILSNAGTLEFLLNQPNPDLRELREIVTDIVRDDERAAHVIDKLQSLFKRKQMEFKPITVDSLVQDVIPLVRSDALARQVSLETSIEPELPMVLGDRVHLSQVLINLIINAMDAVADLPLERRQVLVRARRLRDGVDIAVVDRGAGVPADAMTSIFQPFFTTKAGGIGMGLSVSRSIIEAHSTRLEVNGDEQGATFHFALQPICTNREDGMNEPTPRPARGAHTH